MTKTEQKTDAKKEKTSFRILAYSDVHGDKATINRLVQEAKDKDVDLVVCCGDFTKFGKHGDQMIGPFLDIGKRVVFVPGNHEDELTAEFVADQYGIRNIHGYAVRYDQVGIFGCGGGDVGLNRVGSAEAFQKLKDGFERIRYLPTRVMVVHNHPSGTAMEKFSGIVRGNSGVRRAIEEFQPDIAICGHVHEASGIEEMIGKTRVVNVAKTGKVIEIPLDRIAPAPKDN